MSVYSTTTSDYDTASKSLFDANADKEMFYFGIIYFILSMFNAPFLLVIISTLHLKNCQTPNMTFKMMNIVNFCLLGQGLGHFLTSPAVIFPNLLKTFDTVVRVSRLFWKPFHLNLQIIGATMNTLWICDLPVVTLLAVSRILIFSNMIHSHKFNGVIKFLLGLVLSWIFILFLYGIIFRNMEMYPPGWGYDFTVPFSHIFDTLEICLSFPCLIISFLSYISIAYLIFMAKNLRSSVQSRKNEIAILFQSAFTTSYISGMIFVWHPALFTMFTFIDMEDKTNQAILNCVWIIHCYVNPCMLLIFNKSIRGDCFRFLKTRNIDRNPSRTVMMSIVSIN
ncbi:hypothetical protein CRE_27530 [Caenorhabditis remanei]|uniref:Uncharacterized protein n=1 Tax=Caenorhabditis remanei TaxID=31234 RepID=E3LP42_CAERE|nr:hypothetical protein CRE_27530 [Caenorhabditis remanei]